MTKHIIMEVTNVSNTTGSNSHNIIDSCGSAIHTGPYGLDTDHTQNMKICNFYLDDDTKYLVQAKIASLPIEATKGCLAATIRALLKVFIATDNKIIVESGLLDSIINEYVTTTKKNKRSKL